MRSMGRQIVLGIALAVLHLAAANATEPAYQSVIDNRQGIPVPAPAPIPEYGHLYLRGDLGLGTHVDPDITMAGAGFDHETIDDVFTAGVGFGSYFREFLRGDVTVDYRWDADVSGVDAATGNRHNTKIDSILVLGNLYYDIGRRERFSPYIGVGVGYVKHDTRQRTIHANGAQIGTSPGADSSDFAAAAMAGFSYELHQGFLLDAGYRFLHLGDAKTQPSANGQFAAEEINNIQAHELRVGLRYEIY